MSIMSQQDCSHHSPSGIQADGVATSLNTAKPQVGETRILQSTCQKSYSHFIGKCKSYGPQS